MTLHPGCSLYRAFVCGADPHDLLRLLVLAREHMVEAAVLACTKKLQEQVGA